MNKDIDTASSDALMALRGLADAPGTLDWVRTLRQMPVSRALPLLLMRLDRLYKAEVSPRARLEILRILKRPVLKASAMLPAPDPRLPDGGLGNVTGLTLEQRLDLLMRANLNQLFQELDRKRYSSDVATDDNRHWVLRNLFKFLRRQVRYALLARRDAPRGTWHDLHDLFVYLVIRGRVRLDESMRVDFFDDGFDPEIEYKRLLLMGRAQQLDLPGKALLTMIPQLTDWARASRLADPGGQLGIFDLLLVEVSHDRPLRLNDSSLDTSFRGWVLQPDPRFKDFCRREIPAASPFARYMSA